MTGLPSLAQTSSLIAWGKHVLGRTEAAVVVPAGLSNVVAAAAGGSYTLALNDDGTVTGWGLGLSTAQRVPSSLSNVVALAAGSHHALALRADGRIVTWGLDTSGPLAVPAGLTNVIAIGAGSAHSVALKADGTVVCWGTYYDSTQWKYVRMVAPAQLEDVVAIASGDSDCVALRADGTVVAWGAQFHVRHFAPQVTNVYALSVGGDFATALTHDGMGLQWGASFELGIGFHAVTGFADVAVAAGGAHLLGLRSDGTVVAAGNNDYGQARVPANLTNVYAIAAGSQQSLACVGDGSPRITIQPRSQIVQPNSPGRLFVRATGTPAPHYKWRKNGMDLPAGTNATLSFANCAPTDSGTYSVVVSNPRGSIVSTNAELIVVGTVALEARFLGASGPLELKIRSAVGLPYRILTTSNLAGPGWEVLTSRTNRTGADAVVLERGSDSQRFFRLLQLE